MINKEFKTWLIYYSAFIFILGASVGAIIVAIFMVIK